MVSTLGYNYSLTQQPNHYNNMKINFAQVPHTDIDHFGDEGLFGPDESGNFYYNYVEFGSNPGGIDEVAIVDGCARFMPIAVDNIPELLVALRECYNIAMNLRDANAIENAVNSDMQTYVEVTHVEYEPIPATTGGHFRD